MNLAIQKLFEEKELESFKRAMAQDSTILPALIKILENRARSRKIVRLDDPNWSIKRADYDGRIQEISWLVNFLKEGQGGKRQGQEEKG